jgi:hypothetical protein
VRSRRGNIERAKGIVHLHGLHQGIIYVGDD